MNLLQSSLIYVYFISIKSVLTQTSQVPQTSCSPIDERQAPIQRDITEELIPQDQIQPLPYVSRETQKTDYEDLYESIKEEGLQQPLVVTRQPDSEGYVLFAGGNTRLEIVQRLHSESRGSRFRDIRCIVIPWPGICTAKVSHLITNDVLHNASFLERATAILNFIDSNTDLPIDRTTSDRGVSKFFADHGYPLYRTTYASMKYAVDFLNSCLPLALASSLSALDVKHIQILESKLKRAWVEAGKAESEFNQLFTDIATSCDHEELDYGTFHNVLTEQVMLELEYIQEEPQDTGSQEVSMRDNKFTESIPRKPVDTPDSIPTREAVTTVTKEENHTANEVSSLPPEQEPCQQICTLALDLAHQFDIQDCISLSEHGELGFLVVELPPDEASQTARLVWEYLANFSGVCELSKTELIPYLASDSRLYKEFEENGNSPSLQTARELDLSVMWSLESKIFELLLQLWRAVFEQTRCERMTNDATSAGKSDSDERLVA